MLQSSGSFTLFKTHNCTFAGCRSPQRTLMRAGNTKEHLCSALVCVVQYATSLMCPSHRTLKMELYHYPSPMVAVYVSCGIFQAPLVPPATPKTGPSQEDTDVFRAVGWRREITVPQSAVGIGCGAMEASTASSASAIEIEYDRAARFLSSATGVPSGIWLQSGTP